MKTITPLEVTTMLSILIDDVYKSEVVDTGMEALIEQTEEEWKREKFEELLDLTKQQIKNQLCSGKRVKELKQ